MFQIYGCSIKFHFVHRYSEQTGPHYALTDIEELLTSYNLSLQKLHLPTVDLPASVLERANFDVVEEQAKANSYTMQLNSEQRNVVEILLSALYNNAAKKVAQRFSCLCNATLQYKTLYINCTVT
ncbi:hypothetical protein AVEN_104241-1 [Araneus ventricosus]|uniref:Uncharacterized protein n=1 Tax=Araneus ventricosus TaxID=182803 RepID=A0A4Y2MVY0_ARAVE|nr:hypothetical protein AVEN_104241-1 [Araneus ventricosus]